MEPLKAEVDECFELDGDYQNQFLGNEVFPEPVYKKLRPAERSVNKVHYDDVYILEPLHYYYVTFKEDISGDDDKHYLFNTNPHFAENGLLISLAAKKNRMYIFNASQNMVYIQKGVTIGEVIEYG